MNLRTLTCCLSLLFVGFTQANALDVDAWTVVNPIQIANSALLKAAVKSRAWTNWYEISLATGVEIVCPFTPSNMKVEDQDGDSESWYLPRTDPLVANVTVPPGGVVGKYTMAGFEEMTLNCPVCNFKIKAIAKEGIVQASGFGLSTLCSMLFTIADRCKWSRHQSRSAWGGCLF